ncbi:MAG: hypothetical protein V1859_02570 [archaeon]
MADSNGSKQETVSFSVTPGWKNWLDNQVREGRFRNKSHCAEEALKLLKQRTEIH